ncbi:MAG: hypothetical protein ACJ74W_01290 [Pyrinomonadaceae bacterium]
MIKLTAITKLTAFSALLLVAQFAGVRAQQTQARAAARETPATRRVVSDAEAAAWPSIFHGAMSGSDPALSDTKLARCNPAPTLRVLFVGNSFTYVHNVPALVQEIASSLPGPCIETSMIASGGATLEDHWRDESVSSRIREGRWTHVVLNDQSTFGEGWFLEGNARVGTSGSELMEFGGRFAKLIRQAGANPVFLAHWANADAPARDQQRLDYLFTRVAHDTGSAIANAGRGIKRMQAEHPAITPYFTDKHHLSPAGAYLEAMIIYATLTGRSPVGAARRLQGHEVEFNRGIVSDSSGILVDIPAREASAIQRIAKLTYLDGRGRPTSLSAPNPLSTEFPTVPAVGDKVDPVDLRGHWRGVSRVLPNLENDPVTIDFSLIGRMEPSGSDTLQLITSQLRFVGPATLALEGGRIVVRAPVMPQPPSRGHPQPLIVELQFVMHGDVMIGVATIRQRFAGTTSSFDAIGRFEAKRVGPPF